MFINELTEPRLLVIYPGRFQPFHKGHHAVYNYLAGKFGRDNVYIATSNKTDGVKSPFSFAEKAYFMQLTGVPADRILQAANPYQIQNILSTSNIQVDEANTVVIFAVSEKDMAEDPRFSFATKKDGSQPYFQPLKNIKDTASMQEHGYIMTVPTFDFTVLGQPMRSGTELRKLFASSNEKQRQQLVADLFGRYSQDAEQILASKIPAAQAEPVSECGGTGVVATKKQARDPRYSNSLTKDVLPGQIAKNLRAFNLDEGAVDALAAQQAEYISQDIADIKHRIATERLPSTYVEALKKKIAELEQQRVNITLGRV